MKKLYSLCLALLALGSSAWAATPGVTFLFSNGEKASFAFASKPEIAVTDDGLSVSSSNAAAVVYQVADVQKFYFEDDVVETGISQVDGAVSAQHPVFNYASYYWSTYKHGTSSNNLTKYNSTDGKTILDKEDDAAYVNWGSSCRMPTNDEFTELRNSDNCTWTWTSQTTSSGSSVKGYKVTSVKNGNSIFLPASGYRNNGGLINHGSDGYYWSSTLLSSFSGDAFYLGFRSGSNDRYFGRTVRPVAEQ